jgi:uncharacterized protein with PIN domain
MVGRKSTLQKRPGKTSKKTAIEHERIEEMLVLLLKASLRGRLLLSDRKAIKKFLGQVDTLKKKAPSKTEDKPRCPACRSVLENPRAKRCPYCSVLLGAGLKRQKSKRKK